MVLGEVRENRHGTPMKIVYIHNKRSIDVEFQDENHFVKRCVSYQNFKRGGVRNPYDKTVYGIGYHGVGKYQANNGKKMCESAHSWQSMIERCYSEKNSHKHKAYYGIATCCEGWLNYQNFAEWYEQNKYECDGRLHLDKDILYPGNKLYSPQTCLLVPQRINMLFLNRTNNRGLPNGITKQGKRYAAKYNGNEIGFGNTIEEAYGLYAKEKKKAIVAVAEEYRDKIPDRVYEALLKYEVRMENDKNIG